MNSGGSVVSKIRLHQPSAFSVILRVGLIAGTLDITENLIFNELRAITPKMVFQYIASGLIGMKAFGGGTASVGLGIILHLSLIHI